MVISIFKDSLTTKKTINSMDSHIHINHPNFPNLSTGKITEHPPLTEACPLGQHLNVKYLVEIPSKREETFIYEVNVYGYEQPWTVVIKYIEADGTKKESTFLDEGDTDEHQYYLGYLTRVHDAFPLGRRNAKFIKHSVY